MPSDGMSTMCVTTIASPRMVASDLPVEYLLTERPFSNFEEMDRRNWSSCQPLRRILSQIRRLGGRSMVVECLPSAIPEIAWLDEVTASREAGFRPGKSSCWRLSFFDKAVFARSDLEALCADAFLGYAVIRDSVFEEGADKARHNLFVYESVVRIPRHDNNFVHGAQRWMCAIDRVPFCVMGHLFAQQDGIAVRCSHVAVRTAASRFHPDGDMSYREMAEHLGAFYRQMARANPGRFADLFPNLPGSTETDSLSGDALDAAIAESVHDGMVTDAMEYLLERAGARCWSPKFTPNNIEAYTPPFQRIVYGSIESGYPVIVVFRCLDGAGEVSRHAIPVFGHTLNEDTWVPNSMLSYRLGEHSEYIPSESWVSMYLAHDDNWGSNFCIPRHYLPVASTDQAPMTEEVEAVVATLPRGVAGDSITAEAVSLRHLRGAAGFLKNEDTFRTPWGSRFVTDLQAERLVFRTVLVKGAQYVQHLKRARGWSGEPIDPSWICSVEEGFIKARLVTCWLWMVEVSIPELFSANRRKVGEVVFRASDPRGCEASATGEIEWLFVRLPSLVIMPDPRETPAGRRIRRSYYSFQGHVPLYGSEEF